MINENILASDADKQLFQEFVRNERLSESQAEQFKAYLGLLIEWNEKFNITALTSVSEIISFHFKDSLALDKFINLEEISMIADVGTGGGFPGIPLKIRYPHLAIQLIEVNQKKVQFLTMIAQTLGLSNVQTSDLDWRTFLRKTNYPIDLFVSRASLAPEELIRLFKGDSPYQKARMVYWASMHWHASSKEAPLIEEEHSYKIDHKSRRLIFFKKTDVR
ncbi:16S rRNA (guanine(527)-N(7))-methyltransferase RsmG [Candidatus Dependentiae bacterium]|nr:16S rRNA (guanine(527)-N(7))-methyltransferase RsmG [Candidatus Dependentiae bacterium]